MTGSAHHGAQQHWFRKPRLLALVAAISIAVVGMVSYVTWNAYLNPAHKNAKQRKIAKPRWSELSALQRETLAPLAGEWDHISASGKKTWLIMADNIALKSPEEKARAQKRIQAWAKMTPEQRKTIRTNYALAKKKLKPDQRMAHWQDYQQLTEEQRRELAAANASAAKMAAKPQQKTEDGKRVARSTEPEQQNDTNNAEKPAVTTPAQDKAPT